jgi:outer membrane immunogenic protein
MKTALSAAAALLIATTVAGSAADLPMKAAPLLAPTPVWSWTGFYVGAHVGAGWGTTETTLTSVTASPPLVLPPPVIVPLNVSFAQNSRSGFLGGGQAGYNWQNGWVVFGVQGDIAGTDIKGTTPCVVVLSCTTKSDWLATVTGRVGGVIADRGLLYVKGGGAWLNSTSNVNLPMIGLGGGLLNGAQLTSTSRTSSGWLLGMGLEYMFSKNWTGFIEYDYMDFSAKNVTATFALIPGLAINADQKDKLSIAKVGLNYKFDGFIAPVVAKY